MERILPAATLAALMRRCFEGVGLSAADAEATAEVLLYANLRGIESHGFERVPVYMQAVHAGLAGGSERLSVLTRREALCRMDAGHALGPPAGVRAMDEAVALARSHAVGLVALGNSTNFGAAGFYALRAARGGLIGIATTTAPKLMAPQGSTEAFLGSNPLAIAVPMGERDEFVLDMSSTIVARGKLRRAHALGEPIDHGLALDGAGNPTTDPGEALAGALLPFAGPKGTGLAFAITLLGGLLAGAEFDDEVASIYADRRRRQNLGQLFIAIDPWAVEDRERGSSRASALADRLHALRPARGSPTPRYAGEAAAQRARERSSSGVPVAELELQAVARACRECGLPELGLQIDSLLACHDV